MYAQQKTGKISPMFNTVTPLFQSGIWNDFFFLQFQTGLAPDEVEFIPGNDFGLDDSINSVRDQGASSHYIPRPEVIESLYILHSITKDPIYREWGWEIFQAIETYHKTKIAYGEYHANDGNTSGSNMESFSVFVETIKYLFLLFDPDSLVDIRTKHVFNAAAHPFPVF